MKGGGDVEKLRIEAQLFLAALLGREKVDADRVIEQQVGGMRAQDIRRLFREQGIGNDGGVVCRGHCSSFRSSCADLAVRRSVRFDGEDDLSLRLRQPTFQHEMGLASLGER